MRKLMLAAAAGVLMSFAGLASVQAAPPAYATAAVADPGRPAADTARDANRKPAEMVEFAGVKPGDKVIDFIPAGGYFTRIFAKVVGANGQREAMFLENVQGFGPVMWRNFATDPGDCLLAISTSGCNAVTIDVALEAKRLEMWVAALTSIVP